MSASQDPDVVVPGPGWNLRGTAVARALLGAARLEVGRRVGLIDEAYDHTAAWLAAAPGRAAKAAADAVLALLDAGHEVVVVHPDLPEHRLQLVQQPGRVVLERALVQDPQHARALAGDQRFRGAAFGYETSVF